jgi:hypothetical protein
MLPFVADAIIIEGEYQPPGVGGASKQAGKLRFGANSHKI